jgi:transcriptional regulator with XRE-family HTH domain
MSGDEPFGRMLKRLRNDRGWTLRDLEKKAPDSPNPRRNLPGSLPESLDKIRRNSFSGPEKFPRLLTN